MQNVLANIMQCMLLAYVYELNIKEKEEETKMRNKRKQREERQVYTVLKIRNVDSDIAWKLRNHFCPFT